MVRNDIAKEAAKEPDGDAPRATLIALVRQALELADQHGFARAAIYLDQARIAVDKDDPQST